MGVPLLGLTSGGGDSEETGWLNRAGHTPYKCAVVLKDRLPPVRAARICSGLHTTGSAGLGAGFQ